jgi:hypothetical protein
MSTPQGGTSRGLVVALGVFVLLTLSLAVTTYLGYSGQAAQAQAFADERASLRELVVQEQNAVARVVKDNATLREQVKALEAAREARPIEAMPDINGDFPGGKKVEAGKTLTWRPDDALAAMPLPASRKVKLGQTIKVGNLEVTPTRVERKVVEVFVKGFDKPEPCLNESLVLHLKLKNLSKEHAFVPLEDSFDRLWTGTKVVNVLPLDSLPLTVLQVGNTNFYGGPARWMPMRGPKALERFHPEWVAGRPAPNEVKPLRPGDTQDTFTCTDGQNEKIVPAALAHKGELLWRVHLRQGPVAIEGRDAPVPSTTIIGVPFTAADVAN